MTVGTCGCVVVQDYDRDAPVGSVVFRLYVIEKRCASPVHQAASVEALFALVWEEMRRKSFLARYVRQVLTPEQEARLLGGLSDAQVEEEIQKAWLQGRDLTEQEVRDNYLVERLSRYFVANFDDARVLRVTMAPRLGFTVAQRETLQAACDVTFGPGWVGVL